MGYSIESWYIGVDSYSRSPLILKEDVKQLHGRYRLKKTVPLHMLSPRALPFYLQRKVPSPLKGIDPHAFLPDTLSCDALSSPSGAVIFLMSVQMDSIHRQLTLGGNASRSLRWDSLSRSTPVYSTISLMIYSLPCLFSRYSITSISFSSGRKWGGISTKCT